MAHSWRVILSILSGNVALGISFSVLNCILIPVLSSGFEGFSVAGTIFFAGIALAMLLSPLIGGFSDRLGIRAKFVVLGFGIIAGSCLGIAYLSGVALSVSALIFVSASFLLSPLYRAFVADHCEKYSYAQMFGLTIGITTVSSFLSSFIIIPFYDLSPRLAFIISACSIFTFSIPVLIIAWHEKKIFFNTATFASLKQLLQNYAHLRWLLFAQAGGWFAIGGLLPYLSSILQKSMGISIGEASRWVGFLSLVSGGAALAGGMLIRQRRREALYLMVCISLACFTASAWLITRHLSYGKLVVLPLVLAHLAIGPFYTLGPTILSTLIPGRDRGKAFGLDNTFTTAAQAVGVQLFGALINYMGVGGAFILGTAGFSAAAWFAYCLFKETQS